MAIGRFFGLQHTENLFESGVLDASDLKLKYNISGNNEINPTRISGYAQFSKKLYWEKTECSSMVE